MALVRIGLGLAAISIGHSIILFRTILALLLVIFVRWEHANAVAALAGAHAVEIFNVGRAHNICHEALGTTRLSDIALRYLVSFTASAFSLGGQVEVQGC